MSDKQYMQLAIDLAKATIGQTSPNPVVGAVIVKNGRILSMAAHLKAGSKHAEVLAIDNIVAALTSQNEAASDIAGATLYVTLEPCVHYGKTGPCCQYIIKHKIARVVIASLDPNPLMSGNGVRILKEANIEVTVGILQELALDLNKHFFYYITHKLPYISIKAGISLDGKMATYNNDSKWITNSHSRNDAHAQYRNTHDAILVGINTIIKDDPSLTTRLIDTNMNALRHPLRIILDNTLKTPTNAKVVTDKQKTLIVVSNQVDLIANAHKYDSNYVEIMQMPTNTIRLPELMQQLASRSIVSILVEGGSHIITSFIEQNLFNQLVLYMSPLLLGGSNDTNFFNSKSLNNIDEVSKSKQLKLISVEQLLDNIKLIFEKQ